MIDGPVIQVASGEYVSPLYPYEWTPRITDIAHALSHQARFSGHTRVHYSVCEHSCRVADILPPEHQLAGLLHDASEAYLVDLPTPLKQHPLIGDPYREVEAALQGRIDDVFGVDTTSHEVHAADRILLATEKRDLMPPGPDWLILQGVVPLERRIMPWQPMAARTQFLQRYERLARLTVAA